MLRNPISDAWLMGDKEFFKILNTHRVQYILKSYTVMYIKKGEETHRVKNVHAASIELAVACINHEHVMKIEAFPKIVSAARHQSFRP